MLSGISNGGGGGVKSLRRFYSLRVIKHFYPMNIIQQRLIIYENTQHLLHYIPYHK